MCALLISLACAIIRTTGCLCSCKKFFVNDGASVFSVRGYSNLNISNTLAILLAAQICVSIFVSLLIDLSNPCSAFLNSVFIACALSISTRTPLNLISTRHGNNSVSKSNMSSKSCDIISFFISCHKPRVASASRSA